MTAEPMHQVVERYVAWWQGLPGTLDQTETMFAPDGRFVDPFGDVQGAGAIRRHLEKAYGRMSDVAITVSDRAMGDRAAYLRWSFSLRFGRSGPSRTIIGMSEVHVDETGRVTLHYDHWDAASQVYERVPLLGALLRAAKRKISD